MVFNSMFSNTVSLCSVIFNIYIDAIWHGLLFNCSRTFNSSLAFSSVRNPPFGWQPCGHFIFLTAPYSRQISGLCS